MNNNSQCRPEKCRFKVGDIITPLAIQPDGAVLEVNHLSAHKKYKISHIGSSSHASEHLLELEGIARAFCLRFKRVRSLIHLCE